MDLQDIWNDESLKLAKPVTEWKRYCEQTEIKKIKVIKDKVNLVYLNLYDNVWIMAVLKMLQTFSTPREYIFTLDELLIHRRLARNDGRNFFLSDSPSPIGLITSLGYIYKEKTGQVGILFPVYDYSIDQVPLEEMTSDLRYEIFTQVLSGLKTLHLWGYRHNDVKLENILISKPPMPFLSSKEEKRPEIVLADFGLSDIGKCNLQTVQTLPYRPFECYKDPREKETGTETGTYSRKTDVYALMCTYLALTRKSPLKNNNCYVLQFQSGIFHERRDHVWNFFKKIENQTLDSYYRKCTTHGSIYYNPKSLDEENRKSIVFEKDDWMSDSIIKACLAMDPLKRLSSFQLAKFFPLTDKKKKREMQEKRESRVTKLHLDLVEMLGAYDHQIQVHSFYSDFHCISDFNFDFNLNKILFDILVRETGLDLDFLNVLNFLLRTRKW